jgi:N12 class adenine-specific DNA methylase
MYLEDDSVALMDDLRKAGLSQVDAWVEAYGEVCIEYQSKTTSGFTIVQTNYKMIVPFDEVTDEETLGFLLDDILSVLENHQAAQTPGLEPGMVWIKFEIPSEEINILFKLMDALEERSRGLTGVSMIYKYQQ